MRIGNAARKNGKIVHKPVRWRRPSIAGLSLMA
jgi:hypothetical protein